MATAIGTTAAEAKATKGDARSAFQVIARTRGSSALAPLLNVFDEIPTANGGASRATGSDGLGAAQPCVFPQLRRNSCTLTYEPARLVRDQSETLSLTSKCTAGDRATALLPH
jgi:hypothetical protein